MIKKLYTNESGQVVLMAVVIFSVILSVGVILSSRAISTLSKPSTFDINTLGSSAAEGGVEWFLNQPNSVLDQLADGDINNGGDCPSGTFFDSRILGACVIDYATQNAKAVTSRAVISVKKFNFNNTITEQPHYWFALDTGDVKEVNLTGYAGSIDVCWLSTEIAEQASGLYYFVYNELTTLENKVIVPHDAVGTFIVTGDFVTAGVGKMGYTSCSTLNIPKGASALRLKSLYTPSKVAVIPLEASFPVQGYQITSVGTAVNLVDNISETKKITVYKSLPYAPSVFDYGIYTKSILQ